MRILIVDDSAEKIGAIRNALKDLPIFNQLILSHALDLNNARVKLMQEHFDLLILDLNMPENIGEMVNAVAGTTFLDEIMETRTINKPSDIVVLSAVDESLQQFRKEVEKAGFTVIQYSETSEEWKNILRSRIDYLNLCLEQRRYIPRPPHCDIVVVTAVQVETNAILSWDCKWDDIKIDGDSTIYRRTILNSGTEKERAVIHVQQSEMGMTAAAALVSKAILTFQPKYIFMVGIAAGLGKDSELGDIMVATDIWDYSSGKYEEVQQDGVTSIVLRPDPRFRSIDRALKDQLTFVNYDAILDQIKEEYIGTPASNKLRVHFGQMACGVAVVASEELVNSQVKAHSRKVIGLDMESYGVIHASIMTTNPAVKALIIKSISDFADSKKGDKAQPYAAYTSAQFAKYLIETVIEL